MTHKETAKHVRTRIKHEGIRARVKMNDYCGAQVISVVTPSYDAEFTSDEIKTIAIIAKSAHLTGARGMEINPEHESVLVGKKQFNFYLQ